VFEKRALRRRFRPTRVEKQEVRENFTAKNFVVCIRHQVLLGDEIEEDAVSGTCSTHGRKEKWVQNFGGEI
jgi:hypothetical protein